MFTSNEESNISSGWGKQKFISENSTPEAILTRSVLDLIFREKPELPGIAAQQLSLDDERPIGQEIFLRAIR
jgi:hypothetical protein